MILQVCQSFNLYPSAMPASQRSLDSMVKSDASEHWTKDCPICGHHLDKTNPPNYDLKCPCGNYVWRGK